MTIDGIIFDFDGVLIESEYVGNQQIARTLTGLGYPTTVEQALASFVGLGGREFLDAVVAHIGEPVPDAFHEARKAEDARVLADGIDAIVGAVEFVRGLPAKLPRAIASSSTTHWIETHLAHIGLRDVFGPHIYSGREHVTRGKPAPDIYLFCCASDRYRDHSNADHRRFAGRSQGCCCVRSACRGARRGTALWTPARRNPVAGRCADLACDFAAIANTHGWRAAG